MSAPSLIVIMVSSAAPSNLSPNAVALIFKRKIRISTDGQQYQPVNLAASPPVAPAVFDADSRPQS